MRPARNAKPEDCGLGLQEQPANDPALASDKNSVCLKNRQPAYIRTKPEDLDNVPAELKERPFWLLWKLSPQPNGRKPRKVPYYANGKIRSGPQGGREDRAALVTFEQAESVLRQDAGFHGVGIAMLQESSLVIGDFDDISAKGIEDEVKALVQDTYWEVSPSGRGIRAVWWGSSPDFKNVAAGVELFHARGFVTITGRGQKTPIKPFTAATAFFDRFRSQSVDRAESTPYSAPEALDAAVRESVLAAVTSDTLNELKSALDSAPESAATDYKTWVDVALALKSLEDAPAAANADLFRWFDEFSQKGLNYDAQAVSDLWEGVRPRSVTHKSIFRLAKDWPWVNPRKGAKAPGAPAPFPFRQALAGDYQPPRPLIKGLLDAGSTAMLFGDPQSYKSFLAIDWACSIATGTDWQGRRALQGAVFYIAGEGLAGLRKRVVAWGVAHCADMKAAPIFISERSAALNDLDDTSKVVETVETLRAAHGQPLLVVVDTLHRNFGSRDENNAADVASFLQNIDFIRNRLGCAILIIHHTGHGQKERSRGSSSIHAALDHEYRLDTVGPQQRRLICTKVKDGESPEPVGLLAEVVELPPPFVEPDTGAPLTSLVLRPATVVPEVGASARPLTGANRIAFQALQELLTPMFENPKPRVHENAWRDACYQAGISSGDNDAKRQAFHRARMKLMDLGHVLVEEGEWVRLGPVLPTQA